MPKEVVLNNVISLPLNRIVHSRSYSEHQRNYSVEDFDELVESIKNSGICQPVWVSSPSESGVYMIVDGDHRLDAARKLGMDTIPAMVDETVKPNDDEVEAAVKNYLLNARRISLSFGESASLLKKIETTTQNPKDIKKELEDYYGTAMVNGFPMAVNELGRLKELDEKELEELAEELGIGKE